MSGLTDNGIEHILISLHYLAKTSRPPTDCTNSIRRVKQLHRNRVALELQQHLAVNKLVAKNEVDFQSKNGFPIDFHGESTYNLKIKGRSSFSALTLLNL